MADLRGSPDSSGIWSSFCDRSAWTSFSSASYELKSSEPASVSSGFDIVAVDLVDEVGNRRDKGSFNGNGLAHEEIQQETQTRG